MRFACGTNRFVIVCKNFVYKLPLFPRGIKANAQELNAYHTNASIIAPVTKHWYGLKQERLYNIKIFPRDVKLSDLPAEVRPLFSKKLHNRMQVGQDRKGNWKFFDYEDIKFYLRHETEAQYE